MASVKKSFISSILLIVDSIFKKSVGLLSTLILARVLLPEDFGIIAIATLMTGFLKVFTQTGMAQFIIRSENPTREVLNTAFSLELGIRLFLTVLLLLTSYPIANYYDDTRLISLLQVYASFFFIAGLANPAINLLKRDQNYAKIVKMTMITKVASASVAVAVALIYESYWAMALGQLVSVVLATIGSYVIYPYIPRFQLSNIKEQWRFSGWLIPESLLGYFRTQFDTLLISDMFGQEKLGSYHTMKYLAFIPSSEFILPATQPLLAQLSPLRNKKAYFDNRYTIATIVTMALAIPITVFLFVNSHNFVAVVLGKNWIDYHKLFAWFSLIIPAYAMYHNAKRTFLIYANTKFTFFYEIFCAVFIISILMLLTFDSILELAKIKTSLELVLSLLYFCFATVRYTNLKCAVISVMCSSALVLLCVMISFLTSNYIIFKSAIISLTLTGVFYTICYLFVCFTFVFLTRKSFFVSEYIYSLIIKVINNSSQTLRN